MDNERRQRDEQLMLLQQKLDTHIDDYRKHCENEEERWCNLLIAQERNTQSIKELTSATQDVVSAWRAADGTMRTLTALGKFVKWLSGFAVVGGMLHWLGGGLK